RGGQGFQARHLARRRGKPHRAPQQHGGTFLADPRRLASPLDRDRGADRSHRRSGGGARRPAGGRQASQGFPMTLADKVTAALQASVLPSVIARGGSIRVLSANNGTVTLEMTGSPGAVLPLMARIGMLIRQALPEVENVRVVGPAARSSASSGLEGNI